MLSCWRVISKVKTKMKKLEQLTHAIVMAGNIKGSNKDEEVRAVDTCYRDGG